METLVTVESLRTTIERAWEADLMKESEPPRQARTVMWASAYRECVRRSVYEMTEPARLPSFDATARARMKRGKEREVDLVATLMRLGKHSDPPFEVIGQQQSIEVKGRTGDIVIRGRIDALIQVAGLRTAAPLEVKAWSPNIVDRLTAFEDVLDNQWTKAAAYQLLAYLYGHNQEWGFLLLDRSGLPLLLPAQLDAANMARMETFLAKAESAVAHARAGTLPDYIDDYIECKRCPFFGSPCQPPTLVAGAQVLLDDELEAALEEWHRLKPQGKQWLALDQDIKKRLRGVENALIGHFAISGAWSKSSHLELPPELKKQYTVVDPQGRFTLEVDRL